MTVDETWGHYYEPENKAQSRQCVGPGSPRPKKFETQPSGHSILGRKRRYYIGLFTQEKYNYWSVLCKLVRLAENRHPLNTPRQTLQRCFAEIGQRESPILQSRNGCCRAKRV